MTDVQLYHVGCLAMAIADGSPPPFVEAPDDWESKPGIVVLKCAACEDKIVLVHWSHASWADAATTTTTGGTR